MKPKCKCPTCRRWSYFVKRIPGVVFGVTFKEEEVWEYGDYGERFGCDVYLDIVLWFPFWRFSFRYWRDV